MEQNDRLEHGAIIKRSLWVNVRHFDFRFVVVFIALALATFYEPWSVLPLIGNYLSKLLETTLTMCARWFATHVFQSVGLAATWHSTDSRDTALDWVMILVIAIISLVAATVWSALDRKRPNLHVQAVWVRYTVRLMLIFIMVRYGIFKIFPMQISHPSLGVLNERVGESSPMSLLWTLIGLSPVYQILSGVLETLCAVLLLFSRTAVMGSLLGVIVMSNVVLLNFCFDVPVKLGAMFILLAFTVILWPDVPSLLDVFWKHRSASLNSQWRPELKSVRAERLVYGLEIVYVLCVVCALVPPAYSAQRRESANLRSPSMLTGEWHVDSAKMITGGKAVDAPVLTAELLPMTDVYLEPDGRAMVRSIDGRLWRSGAMVDAAHYKLTLFSYYFDGNRFQATYRYSQPDAEHLRLDPIGADKLSDSTLMLTRVPLPTSYPLLQTRFHWVEEWALER